MLCGTYTNHVLGGKTSLRMCWKIKNNLALTIDQFDHRIIFAKNTCPLFQPTLLAKDLGYTFGCNHMLHMTYQAMHISTRVQDYGHFEPSDGS